MELTESRIVNLENLRKAGTVVLSIKDSKKDIFNKEYRQALTAIHHIVQESKQEAKRYTSKQKNGWTDPCEDPALTRKPIRISRCTESKRWFPSLAAEARGKRPPC